MSIADKKVVSFHYTVKGDDDKVIDTSEGRDPLSYLHGFKNIIPGLENALAGKQPGDKLTVTIPPEEAYGEYHEELVQQVPRSSFSGVDNLEPGMNFHAESEDGPVTVIVTEVTDDMVSVNGNHPLAGKTLHFAVEIVDVRDASEEELSQGHVHGPGGNAH